MPNTFFTSDTHFEHSKIIIYSNRPFSSVEEMDEAMIRNWNNVVGPYDFVYHLGDFSFSKNPGKYFHRLNGIKHLILGNHDKGATLELPWRWQKCMFELKLDKQFIVLCHYGMRVWNKSHYGSIQLYGHSHGTLPGTSQSLDVGVDCWNFAPVNIDQIKERLSTLPSYKDADRHTSPRKNL